MRPELDSLAEPPALRARGYRVTASADRPDAVARLWKPELPPSVEPLHKLRWFYGDLPTGEGEVLVLSHDDVPVGCAGIGPRVVHVAGAPLRAALLTDLSVLEAHRKVMPAIALQRAVRARCRKGHAFAYGFPNRKAASIYACLGYASVGPLTRYARVLRHAEYMRRKPLFSALAEPGGWLLDAPARARAEARRVALPRGLALEWRRTFDDRFDGLWQRARKHHAIIEQRDAAHLRWRFERHPWRAFDVAALADTRAGALRAYAVVELARGTASIWDMLGESAEDTRLLLDLAASSLRARGAHVMTVYAVGARMGALLGSCGFSPRESDKALMVDARELCAPTRRLVLDAASWYVADGGEDS